MKLIKATITALLLSAVFSQFAAHAENSEEFAVKPNRGLSAVQHRQLDTLFDALRDAKNEIEAFGHEQEIWRIWTAPTDKQLSTMMETATEKMQQSDFKASLVVLDKMIKHNPKYAEAWNQRALVNFRLKNYEASLSDIAATLKLEPRHFGALSGRGIIHLEQGETELAEQAILRAMRYHPYIRSRSILLNVPLKKVDDLPYI